MSHELYEDLGLEFPATIEEVKQAFRKLAAIHHPDRKTGNKEAFQKIQHAYHILGDPEKEEAYDLGIADPGDGNRAEVMRDVFDLVMKVIESVRDPSKVDVIEVAINRVDAQMTQIKAIQEGLRQRREKIARLATKFKKKSGQGHNYMETLILSTVEKMDEAYKRSEVDIAHGLKIREMLEDHKFLVDTEEFMQITSTTFGGMQR